MKNLTFIILSFAFLQISFAQERIITGKILDGNDNLSPFPGAFIISNSKIIDTTDLNGNFKFKSSPEIKKIEISGIGIQDEQVFISENCNHIGIIILYQSTYDFITLKTAERKRKRYRNKVLPKLYAEAYEKKLFGEEKSCR